jgi:hypothetical protein
MKFPPAKPLPDSELSQFGLQRDRYMELLNNAKPNKVVSEETDETAGVDNP